MALTGVATRSCQLPVTRDARFRAHGCRAGLATCLAAAQAIEDKCPVRRVTPPTRPDADVLCAFRAGAVGWQSRVNAGLGEWLARHAPEPMVKAAALAAGKVLAKRAV